MPSETFAVDEKFLASGSLDVEIAGAKYTFTPPSVAASSAMAESIAVVFDMIAELEESAISPTRKVARAYRILPVMLESWSTICRECGVDPAIPCGVLDHVTKDEFMRMYMGVASKLNPLSGFSMTGS